LAKTAFENERRWRATAFSFRLLAVKNSANAPPFFSHFFFYIHVFLDIFYKSIMWKITQCLTVTLKLSECSNSIAETSGGIVTVGLALSAGRDAVDSVTLKGGNWNRSTISSFGAH